MCTVLERFNALGLAHSPLVLSVVGKHLDIEYHKKQLQDISIKEQFENGKLIYVNDYPSSFTKEMDDEILKFITKTTNRDYRYNLIEFVKRRRNG